MSGAVNQLCLVLQKEAKRRKKKYKLRISPILEIFATYATTSNT
jgi:hypothetical protein